MPSISTLREDELPVAMWTKSTSSNRTPQTVEPPLLTAEAAVTEALAGRLPFTRNDALPPLGMLTERVSP